MRTKKMVTFSIPIDIKNKVKKTIYLIVFHKKFGGNEIITYLCSKEGV